ncbi:MarR family winged helix-turn-helix transcriptional regulator [Microbacterium rhizophilus]|uniref:MarR family winged helix-turn-helix transcriptional regulator n=1 Tax=Microbacterium rhizophilus TaxID=3138934 RepID=UPI0031EF18D1
MAATDEIRPRTAPSRSMLGWSLTALLREWKARVSAVAEELPHGDRSYQVLAMSAQEEPPTQAALAARLGIDRTVMTYVLDDLERAGLIERRLDPSDRRARRVVLTEAGQRVVDDLDARVLEAEAELLAGLAPEQRDLLCGLLEHAASGAAPGDDRCGVVARG